MDGVRAQNTTLNGYHRDTTPFLQEFAQRGTVYTQARSPSSWSLPSHASIFTGLTAAEHGVHEIKDKLPANYTIWEELSENYGYATGVFSSNPFLTRVSGLKNTFDHVPTGEPLLFPEALNPRKALEDTDSGKYATFLKSALGSSSPVKSILNGVSLHALLHYENFVPDRFRPDSSAKTYTDSLLEWIDERDGPWAACVNYMDAHAPYVPEDESNKWGDGELQSVRRSIDDGVWEFLSGEQPWWKRQALMSLYDGCIHQMDRQIERLVTSLEEDGELENTLIVITSDHGEGFGERSRVRSSVRHVLHGYGAHEVQFHVPLLSYTPVREEGRLVTDLASPIHFPEFVRAHVEDGTEPSTGFVSEDPLLVSSYEQESLLQRAESYPVDVSRYAGDAHAVYVPDEDRIVKQLLWRDDSTALAIDKTPRVEELPDEGAARVERELKKQEAFDIKSETVEDIDSSTEEQLRELGYI